MTCDLNNKLEDLHISHDEELQEKCRQYKNKETQLKQKISELKEDNEIHIENLIRLVKECEEMESKLYALQEENTQVCQELKRTKDELEESKQSTENLAEKLNEKIIRSKDQQALLEKQKYSHPQSIVELQEAKNTELQALQDSLIIKDKELEKILQIHKEEVSEINASKEEELKKCALEKENLQTDKDNMKKALISKLNLSESFDFSLLYKIITGKDIQFGPETRLALSLDNPKHIEVLTSLNKRVPDIDSLSLRKIPPNCQVVKTFLDTHFPRKVRSLNFNSWSSLSSFLPFFLDELMEVSKIVTEQVFIHKFEVSQDQIACFLSSNSYKKWFGFCYCKLDLSSVPDFGGTLAGSTMKGLNLRSCGGSSYGDWGNNESHFENLIAGLSKEEDFRKNLKWIRMALCGMEKNVVEKILADHGFGHVEIGFYSK